MRFYDYVCPSVHSFKEKYKNIVYEYIEEEDLPDDGVIAGQIVFSVPKRGDDVCMIQDQMCRVIPLKDNRRYYGYLPTEQGVYLALRKESMLLWGLLAAFLIFLLCGFTVVSHSVLTSPTATDPFEKIEVDFLIADSTEGDDIKLNTEALMSGSNVYTGYSEAWVNEEYQTLPLVNSAENTAYAAYIIYNGDEVVCETDLIAPGNHIKWNAYEDLGEKGLYALTQCCRFYEPVYSADGSTIDGFIECSTGVTNSTFNIEVR